MPGSIASDTPGGGGSIKGTPIMVDGVMYLTVPDHVWAIDARTGREIWHHAGQSRAASTSATAASRCWATGSIYETPDCHLVSLNIKDGIERWHKQICDLDQFYYGSVAPVMVKNHVIAGVSGDDLDVPGYLEAHDPETGEMQWRWYAVPQKKGEPGSETWPNEEAMQHGGGMTWQPVTYDPELNLIYVTTGNPQPVIAFKNREGANLFTASIVALNPDTGQDGVVLPVVAARYSRLGRDADAGAVRRRGRRPAAQAARAGGAERHFFVLDRTNGKAIVSSDYVKTNWAKGYDAKGQPIPNPAKKPQVDGALVTPDQGGAANWPPPSFSPQTGLFYVQAARAFSVYYIYDPGENPQGWGGTDRGGWSESMLQAIDYKTGKVSWSHRWDAARALGPADNGRQPALRRRQLAGPRRPQRHDGRGALARAARQRRHERADHLRDGWPPVPDRRRGRHAVRVRHEQRKVARWHE